MPKRLATHAGYMNPLSIYQAAALCAAAFLCAPIAPALAQNTPTPEQQGNQPEAPPTQPFPHITIDTENSAVEITGTVPINARAKGVVYLEVFACSPNSKEHEALVVTPARPSHVHAALLLVGAEPGDPGSWEWKDDTLIAHPPTGDKLNIDFIYKKGGAAITAPANMWVRNMDTDETLEHQPFIFAGSRMVEWQGEEFYDADGTGALISLTAFTSETIAWPDMMSPEADVEEPVWIANPDLVPDVDTPVTIRITLVK